MHSIMDLLMHYGWIGLLLVSLAEASFLPVAPDLLLIPLVGANPHLGFLYGAIALSGSLVGGLFGHWIGSKAGYPILRKLMKEATLDKIRRMFDRFGVFAIILAGLIPLPFKLFTISAGVFKVSRSVLLLGALIGRGIRFFGIVLLVRRIGVITIPPGLEMKMLLSLLALIALAVVWFYLRSAKGLWLREKLAGLVQFFRNDFLAPLKRGSRIGLVFLILGTLTSLLIAAFGGDAVVDLSQHMDTTFASWLDASLHPNMHTGVKWADWLFSMPVVVAGYLFVAFMLLFQLGKRAKMRLFAGALIGLVLIQIWFKIFGAPELDPVNRLLEVTSESLPSGHVMAAILLYTSLAYVSWQTRKNWWARFFGLGVSLLLVAVAPLFPVVLGQYSLSSALGGLVAGILWISGLLCTRILFRYVESGRYRRIV
jgi:membrane protein YqaA with SNARE-associated domain